MCFLRPAPWQVPFTLGLFQNQLLCSYEPCCLVCHCLPLWLHDTCWPLYYVNTVYNNAAQITMRITYVYNHKISIVHCVKRLSKGPLKKHPIDKFYAAGSVLQTSLPSITVLFSSISKFKWCLRHTQLFLWPATDQVLTCFQSQIWAAWDQGAALTRYIKKVKRNLLAVLMEDFPSVFNMREEMDSGQEIQLFPRCNNCIKYFMQHDCRQSRIFSIASTTWP